MTNVGGVIEVIFWDGVNCVNRTHYIALDEMRECLDEFLCDSNIHSIRFAKTAGSVDRE